MIERFNTFLKKHNFNYHQIDTSNKSIGENIFTMQDILA